METAVMCFRYYCRGPATDAIQYTRALGVLCDRYAMYCVCTTACMTHPHAQRARYAPRSFFFVYSSKTFFVLFFNLNNVHVMESVYENVCHHHHHCHHRHRHSFVPVIYIVFFRFIFHLALTPQVEDDMILTLNHILLYLEYSHKLQYRR